MVKIKHYFINTENPLYRLVQGVLRGKVTTY